MVFCVCDLGASEFGGFCHGDISLGLFHLLDIKVVQKILNHIGTCLLIVSVSFIRI